MFKHLRIYHFVLGISEKQLFGKQLRCFIRQFTKTGNLYNVRHFHFICKILLLRDFTGRAMLKYVSEHMWPSKAQITDQVIYSPANKIYGYYRMYDWRAKAQMICWESAGWSESAHFAHIGRHFFRLTQTIFFFVDNHYENMPIQTYCKFYHQKMKIFR